MTDFVQLPVDSSGKRVAHKIYNDGLNDVYMPIVSVADRNNADRQQAVTNRGEARVTFDNGSPDFEAFGRTTVSEPNLMELFKFYHKEYPEKFEYTQDTGGTVAYDAPFAGMRLQTTTASGSKARMVTNRFFHYRPANTLTCIFTMSFGDDGSKTNVLRKVGWESDVDGIYFEFSDAGVFAVVKDGLSLSDERVERASWNGDRLDGSGSDTNLSGATLDLTKNSIWWIDFQYLGAGAVRFGTYVDGQKVVCHTIGHYNTLDRPYMNEASMPLSITQENTGSVISTSEMHVYCAVMYNDGYDELDRTPAVVSTEASVSSASLVPILSFRPTQSWHGKDNRGRMIPASMSALSTAEPIELVLVLNDTLTGATYALSEDGIEFDVASTSSASGEKKFAQWVASGRSETIDLSESFMINRDGVTRNYTISGSDHITILARGLTANPTTVAVALNILQIE